jgi:hypothetical protein
VKGVLYTIDKLQAIVRAFVCAIFILIINQISKVQWVDFKLENVLVSLHSLKTMSLGSIIFNEWRVTRTFENAIEVVNIHTLYLLMIGERCTLYDRQITGDCTSFCLCDFY